MMNKFDGIKSREELIEFIDEWYDAPGQARTIRDAFDLGVELTKQETTKPEETDVSI